MTLCSWCKNDPVRDLGHEVLLARHEPDSDLNLEIRAEIKMDLGVDGDEGIVAKEVVEEENFQGDDEVLLYRVEDGVVDDDAVEADTLKLLSFSVDRTCITRLKITTFSALT